MTEKPDAVRARMRARQQELAALSREMSEEEETGTAAPVDTRPLVEKLARTKRYVARQMMLVLQNHLDARKLRTSRAQQEATYRRLAHFYGDLPRTELLRVEMIRLRAMRSLKAGEPIDTAAIYEQVDRQLKKRSSARRLLGTLGYLSSSLLFVGAISLIELGARAHAALRRSIAGRIALYLAGNVLEASVILVIMRLFGFRMEMLVFIVCYLCCETLFSIGRAYLAYHKRSKTPGV